MLFFAEAKLFEKNQIEKVSSFSVRGHNFVVVDLKTEIEAKRILRNKKNLAQITKYVNIYIEEQQNKEERNASYLKRLARKRAMQSCQQFPMNADMNLNEITQQPQYIHTTPQASPQHTQNRPRYSPINS